MEEKPRAMLLEKAAKFTAITGRICLEMKLELEFQVKLFTLLTPES